MLLISLQLTIGFLLVSIVLPNNSIILKKLKNNFITFSKLDGFTTILNYNFPKFMPGWLDWFELELTCPYCGYKFFITLCEDGDISTVPPTITYSIAEGNMICPNCGKYIAEDYLQDDIIK